jgi:hypothetical protein
MAKTFAILFGAVFVLVGLLGFVENPLVGPGAIFHTDALHNIVHLLFGVILLAVAFWSPEASAKWLKIEGVIYLILAALGLLMIPDGGALLGLVEMNNADHWLHIVLAVALILAGTLSRSGSSQNMMQNPSM